MFEVPIDRRASKESCTSVLVKVEKGLKSGRMQATSLDVIDFADVVKGLLNTGDTEDHIEELVRTNIQVIFGQDKTAMIVGQQVYNINNKRCDLVALDSSGALVLIELKRSKEAMAARAEPLELQAIRYAASAATVRTVDELVGQMFEQYVHMHRQELEVNDTKALTDAELARRHVDDFLKANRIDRALFNKQQRIYLVSPGFTSEVLSACAWLVRSGVDMHCIDISAAATGDVYFLQFNEIIPPKPLDAFFVTLRSSVERVKSMPADIDGGAGQTNYSGVKWRELFECHAIEIGDTLILDTPEGPVTAEIKDRKAQVEYKGQLMTTQAWGKTVKQWSTINIYDHASVQRGGEQPQTLKDLRQRVANEIAQESNDGVPLDATDLATTADAPFLQSAIAVPDVGMSHSALADQDW